MARGLSYRDAAVLLGGGPETKVVAALDKLCGGLLLAGTAIGSELALSLFDAKGDLFRLSNDLISGLGDRIRGLSRYDRTRRLEAANAIAVMAAFFECMSQLHLPPELEPDKPEQLALATGQAAAQSIAKSVLDFPPPVPTPHTAHEQFVRELTTCYSDLTQRLLGFLRGLVGWTQLSRAQFDVLDEALRNVAPLAVAKYEIMFRRLAVEFPEFGYWANMLDHQATRAEIRRVDIALAGMADSLERLRVGRDASGVRLDLAKSYQAALRRPGLTSGDLRAPATERCYVNPHFRVSLPAGELITRPDWWHARPLRTDLQDFLVGHLTSPVAVSAPLMVLGHPGAGKSLLTEMLAARLPASDFLTVRVPLRDLPADADLQTQIEMAVRMATGRTITWPELAAEAGDALPVVLLDGFDELLQATGQGQSNYLEHIAAFQRREEELGRPVAVLVTSRLTVADRARPVFGMVTLLLESFNDDQIGLWLEAWNECNSAALRARGLRPLGLETVVRYRDLACQPLLLLLLALYDSDGNALHDGARLNEAEIYERLLAGFTRREVLKSNESLTEGQVDKAVAREMLQLSVVALAMFNRNQLWVTEAELDADLAVLLGPVTAQDNTRLTAAELLVGRFYFVHVAQTMHDQKRLKTYEFLHATFGEFLVARMVVQELDNLLAAAQVPSSWGRTRPVDDQFLHALLSFAPLTMRTTVVSFVERMFSGRPDLEQLGDLLLGLFHSALDARHPTQLDQYRPTRLSVPERAAAYSANLIVLLTRAMPELTSRQLFPAANDHAPEWFRIAQLWRSQLPAEGWRNLMGLISITRSWDDKRRVVLLASFRSKPRAIDPHWAHNIAPEPWQGWHAFKHSSQSAVRAEFDFGGGLHQEIAAHNLEPFSGELGPMIATFHDMQGLGMVSAAHALMRLWLASGLDPHTLEEHYETCLRIAVNGFAPDDHAARDTFRKLISHQLKADREQLPPGWLRGAVETIAAENIRDGKDGQAFLDLLRQDFDLG